MSTTSVAMDRSVTYDPAADFEPVQPLNPAGKRGAKLREAPPYELTDDQGNLNLGSWAFGGVQAAVELAHRIHRMRYRDIGMVTGEDLGAPPVGQVRALARDLLGAADEVQSTNRLDGRADRNAGSHRVARRCVETSLWSYPVPWGCDSDQRADWLNNLTHHAALLMRISVDLFRAGEGE